MKQAAGIVVVALVSIFNMYVGVPAGYGFDLSPVVIGTAAFLGSVGGTVGLVFLGDRVMPLVRNARDRAVGVFRRARSGRPSEDEVEDEVAGKRADEEEREPSGAMRRIADRFGAPGIGLLGPLTIGGFASAVSGIALGYPKVRLAVWIGIGQGLVVVGYLFLIDTAVA